MSQRFAGSRMLGERRRRRLAAEFDEGSVPTVVVPAETEPSSAAPTERRDPRRSTAELPLRKFISPRVWKHWAIGCLGALAGVGILAGAMDGTQSAAAIGTNLSRFLSPPEAGLATFGGSVLLLLSAQLALLIRWVRSQSVNDFGGQYRVWSWAAFVWFLFAFIVGTAAHRAAGELALAAWGAAIWQPELLCWLLPAALIGSVQFEFLHRDMCGCRSSLIMLRLAALCYLAAAFFSMPLLPGDPSSWNGLLPVGTSLYGHLCVFLSMSLHARHVIYVTADPPRPRSIRTNASHVKIAPAKPDACRTKGESRSAVTEPVPGELAVTECAAAECEDTEHAATEFVGASPDTTESRADHRDNDDPRTRITASAEPIRANSPAQPATKQSNDNGRRLRVDSSVSSPDLKGLSKRERRKLRKQRRDQQRSAQV